MLVLQRRRGEQIVIDRNIVVTIVEIRGSTVRFGIEAPKEVTVHRKEVHDVISSGKACDRAARVN